VGANLGRKRRETKNAIIKQIKDMDNISGSVVLDEEGCSHMYHLEEQMMQFIQKEGYWCQRGRIN
jgi:hypothetical protein